MKDGAAVKKRPSWGKLLAVVTSAVVGLSAVSAAGTVLAYDSFFQRYERPDPALTPGMYVYERWAGSLERETLFVPSETGALAAYYYPVAQPKGLVVTVHGMHAGADDLLPLIHALTEGGYAVFAYDGTGTYSSAGENGVGMCQSLVDLDTVLNFLSADARFSSYPRAVVGHSLGGWAAAAAPALHSELFASVAIAAMDDASSLMIDTAKDYAGAFAYTAKPVFDLYQRYRFGDLTEYTAVRGINATSIPVLVAQGSLDETIPMDTIAVTAALSQITNPNLQVYLTHGVQGTHGGILRSVRAEEYRAQVAERLAEREREKGASLTEAELAEFYTTVDHLVYSEVNPALAEQILATLDRGLAL